jgi:hypothetical protein
MMAEGLYIALSGGEVEMDEELEEILIGTNWTEDGVDGQRVAELLR